MRGRRPLPPDLPARKGRFKEEVHALRALGPYLWPQQLPALRLRVMLAILFRMVNIVVPFLCRQAVDALAQPRRCWQAAQ